MSRLILAAPLLLALSACGMIGGDGDNDGTDGPDSSATDADGDGLSDDDEAAWGTDPNNTDSDGDGLDDGSEVHDWGTDPTVEDSDGDGYLDGWEVAEGADPADAASLIYAGGWPYNPDKDSMEQGAWDAVVGQQAPRLVGIDQHGDEVDLYDFANSNNVPIIIDMSAMWCGPCNDVSSYLAGNTSDSSWLALKGMIDNEEIYWVTVLFQDSQSNPTDAADTAQWDAAYPNDNILVITDPSYLMTNAINPPGIPSLSLITPEMKWSVVDDFSTAANNAMQGIY